MKNTFFNKVKFERKVLDTINNSQIDSTQLTGLSKLAIEAWQRNSTLTNTREIGVQLSKLSKLCQTLSDRSHESFQPIRPDIEADIDTEIAELVRILNTGKSF